MKPLAMSFQLVLGQDDRRLYAEIEIVYEDGSTAFRRVPANNRVTLHFDEVAPCESVSTEVRQS